MKIIDTIRTLYAELFTVEFIHPAYEKGVASNIFDTLTVVPDEKTALSFSRLGMDYRLQNNRLVCFIRADYVAPPAKEPKRPYQTIEEDIELRFLLHASPSFLYSTYVTGAGSKAVYHFTNSASHIVDGKKCLVSATEMYDVGKDYYEGAIVNHSGQHYASLRPVAAADAIDISNATFWKPITFDTPVANNADLEDITTINAAAGHFAVLDIHSSGTTNAAYNLFGAANELLKPVYTISFKSKT